MNEPAFPSHGSMGEVVQEGMSLRDFFAAKAIHLMTWGDAKNSAETCYRIADAMLEARKPSI